MVGVKSAIYFNVMNDINKINNINRERVKYSFCVRYTMNRKHRKKPYNGIDPHGTKYAYHEEDGLYTIFD